MALIGGAPMIDGTGGVKSAVGNLHPMGVAESTLTGGRCRLRLENDSCLHFYSECIWFGAAPLGLYKFLC